MTATLQANLGVGDMLSTKRSASSALTETMKMPDFSLSHSHDAANDSPPGQNRVFSAFDEFLDRMPAWIFHTLGSVAAVISLWFALAYLGGLPRGIVEWITLAMMGAFAYAIGFMIPLVVTYLVETRNRLLMALAVVGGGAAFGAMTLSVAL